MLRERCQSENVPFHAPSYEHSVVSLSSGVVALFDDKQALLGVFHYDADTDRLEYIPK